MDNHDDSGKSPGASRGSLTRREWVQRMLAGAGAGIAAPGLAAARSAHPELTAVSPAAGSLDLPGEWTPEFFDDYQNQTLVTLAELIVPGSTGVQVNRFLDTAMAAETRETQQKFVSAMNALEGESLRQFTKPFRDLSTPQQDQVLTAASTVTNSKPTVLNDEEERVIHEPAAAAIELRDHFEYLKGWVSTAYYSSETGMKELGWTGENFFTNFTGCQHSDGHS